MVSLLEMRQLMKKHPDHRTVVPAAQDVLVTSDAASSSMRAARSMTITVAGAVAGTLLAGPLGAVVGTLAGVAASVTSMRFRFSHGGHIQCKEKV
jgi:ABC-type nitrate/sulfonate/bicarbonate transport system permease component